MFDELQVKSKDLLDKLQNADNRRELIEQYIAVNNGKYKAPDIPDDLKWVNSQQLSLGKHRFVRCMSYSVSS